MKEGGQQVPLGSPPLVASAVFAFYFFCEVALVQLSSLPTSSAALLLSPL